MMRAVHAREVIPVGHALFAYLHFSRIASSRRIVFTESNEA
jgi:hypothetical protein